MLARIVAERGCAPELLRSDNGPEPTLNALRDRCRLGGTGSAFIEPGSPWQSPFKESFGSRVRDEVLSLEAFDSLREAAVVVQDRRNSLNQKLSQSTLGRMTPATYAEHW